MKPAPFDYLSPTSLEEAQQLVAEHGDQAKLLAGGQSLIPAMNFRVVQPAVLIDLNRVAELRFIDDDGQGALRIGAMTTQRELERSSVVREKTPLLHECMPFIAHPQIRNRGTLGGSLVHADPAAELPVVAIAGQACVKTLGDDGERWIQAPSFFEGMFMTAMRPDEILVEVEFPYRRPGTGWCFMEASRRQGDYAMMGVAVELKLAEDGSCETANLVYLNAGDGPVKAMLAEQVLQGERPSPEVFAAAANEAAEHEIDPLGNVHATVPYQRHLARVLTTRALEQALARATNGAGGSG